MNRVLATAVFLLLGVSLLLAQEPPTSTVQAIRTAYENFRYSLADSLAEMALEHYDRFQPGELVQIHIYAGSANFAMGREEKARRHFFSALSLNPDFQLDPVRFSPKIISLFEEVRKQVRQGTGSSSFRIRYVLVPDPRLKALWRAAVFPGLGHFVLQKKRKAFVLAAAAGAELIVAGIFYIEARTAHQDYLNARTLPEINRTYDRYRTFYRIRNVAVACYIGTWLYSLMDVLRRPDPAQPPFAVRVAPTGTVWMAVRFAF